MMIGGEMVRWWNIREKHDKRARRETARNVDKLFQSKFNPKWTTNNKVDIWLSFRFYFSAFIFRVKVSRSLLSFPHTNRRYLLADDESRKCLNSLNVIKCESQKQQQRGTTVNDTLSSKITKQLEIWRLKDLLLLFGWLFDVSLKLSTRVEARSLTVKGHSSRRW